MTNQTQPAPECQAVRDMRRPCKKFNGAKLYCDCGCMAPINLNYNLDGVQVSGRASYGYADYNLSRNGQVVGDVNTQYGSLSLDGVEYLSISKTSPLYRLVQEARDGNIVKPVKITEVMTYAEVKDTTTQDMDNRNGNHPGYCRKCHTYCYGDCES